MNPESILEFAVKHCEIGVNIKRKNGEVKVRGLISPKLVTLLEEG